MREFMVNIFSWESTSEMPRNLSHIHPGKIPYLKKAVLQSRSRKEPHLLVGAVSRCGSGSGSDGSGSDNGIKHG
jgi:hypothetical protein